MNVYSFTTELCYDQSTFKITEAIVLTLNPIFSTWWSMQYELLPPIRGVLCDKESNNAGLT